MVGFLPSRILNLTVVLTETRLCYRRSLGRQNLLKILSIDYPCEGSAVSNPGESPLGLRSPSESSPGNKNSLPDVRSTSIWEREKDFKRKKEAKIWWLGRPRSLDVDPRGRGCFQTNDGFSIPHRQTGSFILSITAWNIHH